jgi:4,5-DOPA dioxygenase extradiol
MRQAMLSFEKRDAKTPVLFVGHGSPMNAIEDNFFSRPWADIGTKLLS